MSIKTITLTAVATSSLAFSASAESALETQAINFLSARWNNGVQKAPQSKAIDSSQRVSALTFGNGATAVNITSGDKHGFVLYAGSATDAVMVGYGLTDTIDVEKMPPALEEFLSIYKSQKESASNMRKALNPTSQPSPTYPFPTVAPVEPFIKTKWGQQAPFNNKCPLYQGTRSVAGCDATAVGQILHYYKASNFNDFTIEYADERSLEEVSVKFSDWSFDYGNRLDIYEEGNYTQQQADAVAQMMYIAGAACKMNWSSYKSSGQWPLVALDKYFNINANFYIRENISSDFWMRKIQENLTAGSPILYTGTGVSNYDYSAHIFILDGIDDANYVHVNWGWDGNSDGYYDITFCHPDIFSDDNDGYYMKQMMICDIEPRKEGEAYKERYVATSSAKMSIYNDSTCLYGKITGVTNNGYEAFDLVARQIYRSVDNPDIFYADSPSTISVFPNWSYMSWDHRAYYEDKLPDGKWEVRIQTYDEEKSEVVDESSVPMRPYFVKKNGKYLEAGYMEDKEMEREANEYLSFMTFEPITDVIAKAPFYARVKTKSLLNQARCEYSTEKTSDLCFTNVNTGKKYITPSNARPKLYGLNYAGLEYEGIVKIMPPTNPDNGFTMPAGEYVVTVVSPNTTDEDTGVVYPEPLYVTVRDAVDYPILIYDIDGTLMQEWWHYGSDYTKKWSDHIAFKAYKGILPSNNNYNPVVMMLYAQEAENVDAEEIMISAFNFDPQQHFYASTTDLPGNLYPLEGKYIFYLRYLTADGLRDILPLRWDYVDKATGLPATPTPHFIQANQNAGLPMIEVESLVASESKIKMEIKNLASTQFNGQIIVQGLDYKGGEVLQAITEPMTIEANGHQQIELPVEMSAGVVYDAYVRAIASAVSRGATDTPTMTTKPDGSIAHYQIEGPSAGIGSVPTDKDGLEVVVKDRVVCILNLDKDHDVQVYSIDGRLITHTQSNMIEGLSSGIYVLNANGQAVKVVIP